MMLFDQITTAYFFAATDASVVMLTVILSVLVALIFKQVKK